MAGSRNRNQGCPLRTFAEGLKSRCSNLDRTLSGTNHALELQPKRNLFYCGYCRVGGGKDELDEFTAQRRITNYSRADLELTRQRGTRY